jgi:hypothetical protein
VNVLVRFRGVEPGTAPHNLGERAVPGAYELFECRFLSKMKEPDSEVTWVQGTPELPQWHYKVLCQAYVSPPRCSVYHETTPSPESMICRGSGFEASG